MPKTDSLRITLSLAHSGQATAEADEVETYRSNSR